MSDNASSQTIRRRDPKEFGPLKGLTVGDTWETRRECSSEKVHPPIEKGIYGDKDGARSIVISGGYEDDVDEGDTIYYTGSGGRDDHGHQIADQTFDGRNNPNASLRMNIVSGDLVRVIRGADADTKYSPLYGFRYDGLYEVEKVEYLKGKSGFRICRFTLKRIQQQLPAPWHQR